MGTFERFDKRHTAPPALIARRDAVVQLGATNTLRYPGDLHATRANERLTQGHDLRGKVRDAGHRSTPHLVHEGNHCQFFIDAEEAMTAMVEAMDSAVRDDDYIYMLNWWADPSLVPPGSARCLGYILGEARDRKVQIRGIFWRLLADEVEDRILKCLPPWREKTGQQNLDMVRFINEGHAVVTDDSVHPGQKIDIAHPRDATVDHDKVPYRRVGAAIHDHRLNRIIVAETPPPDGEGSPSPGRLVITVGSHHQKVLCVRSGGVLRAFCGGVDWNRDRIELGRKVDPGDGSALHDVHCEIQGPAAGELLQTFLDRWQDHPDSAELDRVDGPLRATADHVFDTAPKGRLVVQVGRTFGGGALYFAPAGREQYAFATNGEITSAYLIAHAISSAKKFVYLEDQYFVSEPDSMAADALCTALDNGVAHITIVLPHHCISDMPYMARHRRALLKRLRDKEKAENRASRLRVFYRCASTQEPGDWHTYVHSKCTIIDDDVAIIGSVNYGRRSWSHDSEICAGIYDPADNRILTGRFARWLRIRLWAEHLFGIRVPPSSPDQPPEGYEHAFAELWDGVAAGALWLAIMRAKRDYLRKHGERRPIPSPIGPVGDLHPRDWGYEPSFDDGAFVYGAEVRHYDEYDDPLDHTAPVIPVVGFLPFPLEPWFWDTIVSPG